MPVIKSAIKKLRQDRKKELVNDVWRKKVRDAIHEVKKSANEKTIKEAFSIVDKAAKRNIMHANKADRIKSRLVKMVHADAAPASKPQKTKKKATTSKTSGKKS